MAVDIAEITEYKGEPVRVLRNGALLSVETGKIVGQSPQHAASTVISTTERATELANARWHKPRQDAILQAVREATGDEAGQLYKDHSDADGYLTKEIVSKIVLDDSGATRGADRVKAWEAVLEHSGTSGKAPKQTPGSVTPAEAAAIGGSAAVLLHELIAAELARRSDEQI